MNEKELDVFIEEASHELDDLTEPEMMEALSALFGQDETSSASDDPQLSEPWAIISAGALSNHTLKRIRASLNWQRMGVRMRNSVLAYAISTDGGVNNLFRKQLNGFGKRPIRTWLKPNTG